MIASNYDGEWNHVTREKKMVEKGWGMPAPAAFGWRLNEQRRAAEELERQKVAAAEARRMDFASKDEYPTLGGGKETKKVAPKLNFRAAGERGAILSAAQEAEKAAAEREKYYASYTERMEAEERNAAHRRRLAQITNRCYDDGFDEFEPPYEEDEIHMGAGYDDSEEIPAYEEDVSAATSEFNSHLAVTRRRGDKSDW